ncbi:Recombination-associated protein RdgC [Desulfarculales bacterium]
MGLIMGSLSLSRYQVKGNTPPDFWDFVDQRIRANLFLDIEDSTEEQTVGWVSIHDYFDVSFAYASYVLDPYVVLGLRWDRRRVPAGLLKKYHILEMKKALAACGGRGLSRADREDFKEKVRLDLLRRTLPSTQVFEVCWDTQRGEVWLGSTGRGVRDIFEDLFRRTFDLRPWPRIPYLLASDLLGAGPLTLRLEAARPLSLYEAEA